MPELPEVETIRRSLLPLVVGRELQGVDILDPLVVKYPAPGEWPGLLRGRRVEDLERRGKYLLFQLSGQYILVVHLRMTGRLLEGPAAALPDRYTRVVFLLDNGRVLRFHDVRRFGLLYLLPREELDRVRGLALMGPEPLDPGFSAQELAGNLAGRQARLKACLLDQHLVAGIGNIYADEILFAAGLSPQRRAASLSPGEIDRLYQAMRTVLAQGVKHRGTTLRDYRDGLGGAGEHQHHLQVYGKSGQPCPRCSSPLQRDKIGGRSSHYCPRCQPS